MAAACTDGDCDGCREFRAIHGAFSLEVPYAERLAKRANDLAAQWRYEDAAQWRYEDAVAESTGRVAS